MVLKGDDFLAKLLETFRGEAQEHLSAITAGLLILEKSGLSPDEFKETIEKVFRETHSLKGAARAVGLRDIETLCQHQESVFSAVKKGTLELRPDSFDLFHRVIQALEHLLGDEKGVKTSDLIQHLRVLTSSVSPQDTSTPYVTKPSPVINLENLHPKCTVLPCVIPQSQKDDSVTGSISHKIPSPEEDQKGTDTVIPFVQSISDIDENRISSSLLEKPGDQIPLPPLIKSGAMVKISSDRLEHLFERADDLMGARLASGQRSSSLRDLLQIFMSWRWSWSQITTDIEHMRTEYGKSSSANSFSSLPVEIERISNFLEYNRVFIRTLEGDLTAITRAATRDQYLLDSATTELIDEIKQVILVPASSILDTYPRIARDLARENGKDVDVDVSGADIEIDRRILEGIRDPILHIIRNSIDHGIESPDIRLAKGKSERGLIRISVVHSRGHQAEIHVTDDGRGIDLEAVKSVAVAKGLITPEELSRMDSNQVCRVIFKSGLSTKSSISTISGRGLGLAIALEKIEQIGGTIKIETSAKGTSFILTLPLTLATFRGLQIISNRQPFFFPLRSIDRVMQIRSDDIKTIENRTVIEIGGESIAMVSLAQVLGMTDETGKGSEFRQMILVSASGIRFGLLVDRIAGAQEIVVKNLGPQLRRVRHFNGASILGDGVIVPVINCEDLAATISGMDHIVVPGPIQSIKSEKRSILVVEDSITSRMLLKNILESAGYLVETAVDGVDAMTKLKLNLVDLIVSDVDMPRMNGFVLTEKVRSDPSLSEIPIVLVTSLDSREDREHGIMVGASAYIVKSSFDQSNLLEVISRHIL